MKNAALKAGDRLQMFVLLRKERCANGEMRWIGRCDCGVEKFVRVYELRNGRKTSCGCALLAARRVNKTTHGQSESRTYSSWQHMIKRCHGKNAHPHYVAMGVTVCPEWRDFSTFYADMGERPEGTTIDRINGYLGYFPGNCRWADSKTQARNKVLRQVLNEQKVVELRKLQGVVHYKDAARQFGVSNTTVHAVWNRRAWGDVGCVQGSADMHRRDSIKRGGL